jgi:nucleoside-diphosphate-sugar epimerase
MSRAVIIGGRGQCGHAIGQRLVAEGWTVTATTTGPCPDPAAFPGIAWLTLDRDNDDVARAANVDTDVVIDTVAFTRVHAEQLIALGDRIGSAIVLSTLSVYTDPQGRTLDESTDEASFPAWPLPIPEDYLTLSPSDASYSTRKAAIEDALRHRAPWPVTIVRPGAIHGSHSQHLREWYFIKRVLDRRRQVILPFNGESIFQPTATVNLAELVALAAKSPAGRTVNCGDLQAPSVAQISAIVDDLMNWSTERQVVAGPEPAPTVGNHPWGVPRPVVADMTRAQTELGYREQSSYGDALAETLTWVLSACAGRDWREVLPRLAAYPTNLFDYEAEDAYLASS